MREGQFIKRNIDKWRRYQYEKTTDPDEMARRFTELIGDLGYARTFYPASRVTEYLNGLSGDIYLGIYRNRKEPVSRIARFWKTDLPVVAWRHRRELLYAFCIFTLFAVMAAFSAAHDETFVRGVLGDSYVAMTDENIARGDPFGVFKDGNKLSMFVSIAVNNIGVAFMAFTSGLIACIGTLYSLFSNGVMVGAFQYYFFSKGLGWASVLVIWIHGTIEISSIIIAGGAGLVLGKSFLFPGTHSRWYSLRRGARDGLVFLIGLIPFFIVAAFFEGFVTRYSSMPVWLSIGILAGSLVLILWYFVVYPGRVVRRLTLGGSSVA